jgi:hypothetical protein
VRGLHQHQIGVADQSELWGRHNLGCLQGRLHRHARRAVVRVGEEDGQAVIAMAARKRRLGASGPEVFDGVRVNEWRGSAFDPGSMDVLLRQEWETCHGQGKYNGRARAADGWHLRVNG